MKYVLIFFKKAVFPMKCVVIFLPLLFVAAFVLPQKVFRNASAVC